MRKEWIEKNLKINKIVIDKGAIRNSWLEKTLCSIPFTSEQVCGILNWSSQYLPSLTSLNLKGVSIKSAGAQFLANAMLGIIESSSSSSLSSSSSSTSTPLPLLKLNLDSCQIGDEGCTALAKAMKVTYQDGGFTRHVVKLQTLQLSDNAITDRGIIELAQALKLNTELAVLEVEDNNYEEEGVSELLRLTKFNYSLLDIRVDVNQLKAFPILHADMISVMQPENRHERRRWSQFERELLPFFSFIRGLSSIVISYIIQ